jgi:hypothetical protein
MSKPFKIEGDRRPAQAAEGDVLNFLSRTLQAHFIDGEQHGALEKLQTLLVALEKQERTLSDWPDSASKARICAALGKARDTVAKIVEDLARHPKEATRAPIGGLRVM